METQPMTPKDIVARLHEIAATRPDIVGAATANDFEWLKTETGRDPAFRRLYETLFSLVGTADRVAFFLFESATTRLTPNRNGIMTGDTRSQDESLNP